MTKLQTMEEIARIVAEWKAGRITATSALTAIDKASIARQRSEWEEAH